MSGWRRWLRNAAGSTAWAVVAWVQPAHAAPQDFMVKQPSADAVRLVDWVLASGDAHGKPFAVVDKRAARLYVFGADGRLAGATPAILGSTIGDQIVPGVGERAQERIATASGLGRAPILGVKGDEQRRLGGQGLGQGHVAGVEGVGAVVP